MENLTGPFGVWPLLVEPATRPLVAAISECADPAHPSALTRFRKDWPAELVAGAVRLVLARRKAATKWPHWERLVADPVGVEQATSLDVGRHKTRRFAECGVTEIVDLCCGIGGDAMAFSETLDVYLVDADPARVWMARHNVAQGVSRLVAACVADVTRLPLPLRPFHIDPERRTSDGRRQHRFDEGKPDGAFLLALIDRAKDGALKLSPGVDLETLPRGEIELINWRGTLVQTVLWTGRLAREPSLRTATRLPEGATFTDSAGLPIPCADPARYLLTVDPAIERAGLVGALCQHLGLPAIHPALGLLTADTLPVSPWVTPYEHIETLPWREKAVKAWLVAHDAGEVTVKTRDRVVDPDSVSKRLRGKGSKGYTVFVMRMGQKVVAWITVTPITGGLRTIM